MKSKEQQKTYSTYKNGVFKFILYEMKTKIHNYCFIISQYSINIIKFYEEMKKVHLHLRFAHSLTTML
jgi:hypothetical protein